MSLKIKDISKVVRVKFLSLSLVIGLLATSIAFNNSSFELEASILGFFVLFALHMSVNSLNSASDARRGIDKETEKTEFSGGIKTIVNGKISHQKATAIGLFFSAITLPVFVYFGLKFDPKTVFFLASGSIICVLGYTDFFARVGLGELVAGIGLGTLPVITMYYFQTGEFSTASLYTSILMAIPVFNLLLLNEYPDLEADRKHGRYNIPLALGKKTGIKLYGLTTIIIYAGLLIGVSRFQLPSLVLLGLIPSLISLKILKAILNHNYSLKEEILKINVLWVHITILLTGLGFLIPNL